MNDPVKLAKGQQNIGFFFMNHIKSLYVGRTVLAQCGIGQVQWEAAAADRNVSAPSLRLRRRQAVEVARTMAAPIIGPCCCKSVDAMSS